MVGKMLDETLVFEDLPSDRSQLFQLFLSILKYSQLLFVFSFIQKATLYAPHVNLHQIFKKPSLKEWLVYDNIYIILHWKIFGCST